MRSRLIAAAILALLSFAKTPEASAGAVRISQVYPGGGISSAGRGPYASDYVELFNSGSTVVDISGWILAYGGSNPTIAFGFFPGSTQTIPPGSAISPCGYFLIQTSGPSDDGGLSLPTPDARLDFTNPNLIPGFGELRGTGGALALMSSGAPSGGCVRNEPGFEDDVAWRLGCFPFVGSVTQTVALIRKDGGMVRTGDGNSDFLLDTPSPRNSASAKNPACLQSPVLPTSLGRLKAIYH